MRMIGSLVVVALTVVVVASAQASGSLQDDAAATFAGKCAMCHGTGGAGDGMAAAAMDPKPTDLTSAEFQDGRTDEEIAAAIKAGKGAMPGYAKDLSDDAIKSLVAYIRTLRS